MNGSVFPSVSPADLRWEDCLDLLTPVDRGESGLLYKREDMFAPLGYGGINGSKLRQLIRLMEPMRGGPGVLTACSVISPQSSMTALVGRHFGIPVTVMLGATHRESALKHENVRIADRAGARLVFTPVAYNPALQRAADAYQRKVYQDRVHYGITTAPGAEDTEVEFFHALGAQQTLNIPSQVRTLVITAGSCNSVASVLYGLAKYGAGALSRVVLLGIGPTRILWLRERLAAVERASGRDVSGLFTWRCHDHPELSGGWGPVLLEHRDLHSTGYVRYADRRPWAQDGIHFHPTYEGKAMTWLNEVQPHWWRPGDGSVLFWIVGSAPSAAAMEAHL